jgi:alcohol dehydrogenase
MDVIEPSGGSHASPRLPRSWAEGLGKVADPEILDDGDAIVRVDATTICGTDLHILKGDVPAVHQGRILGHEADRTVGWPRST